MDAGSATYLEENIGGVLAKALAEMAVVQPKDGVDFLASWLSSYSEQEQAKSTREQAEKELAEQRAEMSARTAAKEEIRKQKQAEADGLDKLYNTLFDKFSNAETVFEDGFWQELVDVSQASTGSTAVYLGIAETGEEGSDGTIVPAGPYISYEYATKGSEWMTEEILAEGKGMTWGALTENPPEENFKDMCLWKPPICEPVAPEPVEGEEPPPEKPGLSYYPVSIDCVTDVKGVHYFDMTRLGAFLAIPLVYPSYYTGDALTDAKTFEQEKKEEEKKRAEEEAARLAAIEAGEAPADEAPPEAAEPVEEKTMVLRGTDVKMVLCMDTLGTNKAIDEVKAMKIFELVKACGQCKSQTEFKQVDAQALTAIDEEMRAAADEKITECSATVEENTSEAFAAEDAEAAEERKDLLLKKYAFLRALKVAQELADMISGLSSWVYMTPEVLNVLAAIALLAGYPKEEIYPRRKTSLSWEKLKFMIEKPLEILEKLGKIEFEGPRKGLKPEQKNAFIQQMASPADMDAEKAKEVAPGFMLLFNVVQAACAYRTADLEARKAEYNKQKEEAGEEWSGPALEELDDDFEAA